MINHFYYLKVQELFKKLALVDGKLHVAVITVRQDAYGEYFLCYVRRSCIFKRKVSA